MKIGIIGGGIGGLTCSYELAKKNIDSVIFEQEPLTGGKILYNIGTLTTEGIYKNTHKLIKELGLEVLLTPLPLKSLALLIGDQVVGGEQITENMKKFSPEEAAYFQKLNETLFSLDFNVERSDEKIEELSNISFAEYIKDCPDSIRNMFITAIMNFTFETDYEKIAADYGLCVVRHGLESFTGKGYVFEENLIPLSSVLYDKLVEKNKTTFSDSSKVDKVEKTKDGFQINFKKDGKTNTEKVDQVVFTSPLPTTSQLLPELKIESNIDYKPIRCLLMDGELKYDQNIIINVKEMDQTNLSIMATNLPDEHLLIPLNQEKEVDLNFFYNNYQKIGEKKFVAGWPVRPPKAKVPSLKTNIEGAYLCGDFYRYPFIEAPITTAQMVAKMISE